MKVEKKEKKVKKVKEENGDKAKKATKARKRKAEEVAPPVEEGKIVTKKMKKEKKSPKAAATPAAADVPTSTAVAAPAAVPHALDTFPLAEPIKAALRAKNIEALFPIQVPCIGWTCK
jgi:outer membrane biosynthesis protein TonB